VDVFNHGEMLRDFTYVDDAVEAVLRVCDKPAEPDPRFDSAAPNAATSNAPYRVFNVGNSQPVPLLDFIGALESSLGRAARKNLLPMQPGDVQATAADTAALEAWVGFRPATALQEGVRRFAEWYLGHYPGGNKEAVQ
jgi:UDP-glucuronate 4-epimerase